MNSAESFNMWICEAECYEFIRIRISKSLYLAENLLGQKTGLSKFLFDILKTRLNQKLLQGISVYTSPDLAKHLLTSWKCKHGITFGCYGNCSKFSFKGNSWYDNHEKGNLMSE